MAIVTRRAAWRDGPVNGWHDDLVWYAAAIHRMRALSPGLDDFFRILWDALTGAPGGSDDPVRDLVAIARNWDDPRSLGYQSQVHGTWVPKPDWPTVQGQQALWQECAHNHWFFLPWHRAYLLDFEAVAREHIRELGGPADDWGLPYWNYTDHEADRDRLGLPLPLRGQTLPPGVEVPGVEPRDDGTTPNPLFVPVRLRGEEPTPSSVWANAATALLRPHYANQEDIGRVSLGGGVIEQPDNPALWHEDSREIGQLDAQPHGSVHNHINGAMAMFPTAALDPVFWMHHCNVDRLWETYAHDLQHGYPFQDGSGTGTAAHGSWTQRQFRFLRPDGSTGTWTAPDVLDVRGVGYAYDTTAPPPLPPVPPPPPPGSGDAPFGIAVAGPVPEPVAESELVYLAGEVDVAVTGGSDADRELGLDAFPDAAWLLRFEGIRSDRPARTSYLVSLGLPPGQAADPDDADHYAGLLSLFGVYEASRDDGSSAGSGQRRLIDVTAQVSAQGQTFRPLATSVRLTPVDPDPDPAAAPITIDRITLEFA